MLAVDGRAQRSQRILRQIGAGQQDRDHPRRGQIDGKSGHADGAQGFHRQQHRLRIGSHAVAAKQLRADLHQLALRIELIGRNTQHLARIAKPQGTRFLLQAGCRDAGDLHGHVRAHAHHLLRDRVHQTEGTVAHGSARPGEERGLELHQRRLHPVVAMRGTAGQQGFDNGRFMRRIKRQHVTQPRRQQGTLGQFALAVGMRHAVSPDKKAWKSPCPSRFGPLPQPDGVPAPALRAITAG